MDEAAEPGSDPHGPPALSADQIEASVRDFLAAVDPETGYIE